MPTLARCRGPRHPHPDRGQGAQRPGQPVPRADDRRPQGGRPVDRLRAGAAHRPGGRQREPPPQGARRGRPRRRGARARRATAANAGGGWPTPAPSGRGPTSPTTPAAVTAARAAEALNLRRQFERLQDWMANAETGPEWDDVSFATQNWLKVAPEELREVAEEVDRPAVAVVAARAARRRPGARAGVRLRPRVPGPAMTPPHRTGCRRRPLHRNRDFNLLWLGEGVSVLGNATTVVLLPLLAVVGFDAGPGWMGVLTACAWLPWLVIGLPAGPGWTTWRPVGVMVASDLVGRRLLASVPVAWRSRRRSRCPSSRWSPCERRVHGLLPGGLPGAGAAGGSGRAAGAGLRPALRHRGGDAGGRPGTRWPPRAARLGGLGHRSWTPCRSWCPRPASPGVRRRDRSPDAARRPIRCRRIREGVRYLRDDRLMMFFTVMGGVSNFGLTGFTALMVVFMVDDLDLARSAVGVVMAVGSTGGLLGAALATRVSSRLGSARGLLWLQVLAGPPALLVVLGGAGPGVVWLARGGRARRRRGGGGQRHPGRLAQQLRARRHAGAADDHRPGASTSAPCRWRALMAGWLGSAWGVRETIALMAAIHALACASLWWSPLRGRRDMPRPASDPGGPLRVTGRMPGERRGEQHHHSGRHRRARTRSTGSGRRTGWPTSAARASRPTTPRGSARSAGSPPSRTPRVSSYDGASWRSSCSTSTRTRPGHLMVCPYRHVADYTETTPEEAEEIGAAHQAGDAHAARVSASRASTSG